MYSGNRNVDKAYKKTMTSIVIGAIFLSLTVLLLILGTMKVSRYRKDVIHLNDAILSEDKDKYGKIAYLDALNFFEFATYGDDYGYYIAYDDDFYYLIGMSDKVFDHFAEEFEGKEYLRLYGYTEKIPAEVRGFAIEAINEELGENSVTEDNFNDAFGDTLLKVEKEKSIFGLSGFYEIAAMEVVLGAFSLIIGLILLLTGLSQRKSFETLPVDVREEIAAPETEERSDLKLLLGNRHLFSYAGKIDAVDYDDIFWVYPTQHSTNGIHDYNFLNIVKKDGSKIVCGNSSAFGKKRREQTTDSHVGIMEYLHEKNPEIRLGYLEENLNAYNELVKSLKKK